MSIAKRNEWPIYFFSALELAKVNVPSPSNVVLKEMGTGSVAEAAAILRGGKGGRLIQEKQIYYPKEGLDKLDGILSVNVALTSENQESSSEKSESRFQIDAKKYSLQSRLHSID